MKNHVYRPLFVVIVVVGLILVARYLYVPKDFGIYERGFMYGYHRKGNEAEWEKFKVKYRTKQYCKDCHPDKYETNMSGKHRVIQCENCHGPAIDHPENPPKLKIDRSRALCIRCHSKLPYPTSKRGELPGINPEEHNTGMECADCHNPHKPDMEGW
ncbi:MAG: cytochrome C [Nitrospirae bacterium]|nr:MAG: cytochrome C [Nitrospirota bacterium]